MEVVNSETVSNESEEEPIVHIFKKSRLLRKQTVVQSQNICAKNERTASLKKVSVILQKSETDRTFEESQVLNECSEVVEEVQTRWKKRDKAKRRVVEFEEPAESLDKKCLILAQAIAQSQHLVVYTGAGISTAAKIPDYRGPNGIWTRLQQGKDIGSHDLSMAEPTFTHMALSELYRRNILKYVVSQNCDGLHMRSGLPRTALSELHGNMYLEVCKNCKPHREYWRLFDVTENTARYAHKTSRRCYQCNEPLVDTIVHFGERGSLPWPMNWSGACKNANKATTILCLGSSLKVLKKYPWLWQMDKPIKKRPNLYIINLQWTPKDDVANVKIHGKCDHVMRAIMRLLDINVGDYDKVNDPIFYHCSLLNEEEAHTTSQPALFKPSLDSVDTKAVKTPPPLCDTSNTPQGLLAVKQENPFSIDNILQDQPKIPQPDIRHAAMNYPCFNFSTDLLQYQILGKYGGFFYYPFPYPYHTSFLYPGLHSIINPSHEVDIHSSTSNDIIKKQEPTCEFCFKNFTSTTCLFYSKYEPTFVNLRHRFSKLEQKQKINICVCCDYSTDEEDVLETDTRQGLNKDSTAKKVQAGWFGKGFRKARRLKRK